jgi:hypothetical protein
MTFAMDTHARLGAIAGGAGAGGRRRSRRVQGKPKSKERPRRGERKTEDARTL